MNHTVIALILLGLVISSAVCIFLRNLIKAAISMAIVSGLLSIIMFILGAPLAGAIELSVCAGLIPVIFISTISMTRIQTKEELEQKKIQRRKRFIFLPALLLGFFTVMVLILYPYIDFSIQPNIGASADTVQDVLWITRKADLLGQITIILVGVFGVIVFFKERTER